MSLHNKHPLPQWLTIKCNYLAHEAGSWTFRLCSAGQFSAVLLSLTGPAFVWLLAEITAPIHLLSSSQLAQARFQDGRERWEQTQGHKQFQNLCLGHKCWHPLVKPSNIGELKGCRGLPQGILGGAVKSHGEGYVCRKGWGIRARMQFLYLRGHQNLVKKNDQKEQSMTGVRGYKILYRCFAWFNSTLELPKHHADTLSHLKRTTGNTRQRFLSQKSIFSL